MQLHPHVQYLESPIAGPEDFERSDIEVIEAIENQPEPVVYGMDTSRESWQARSYLRDTAVAWPDWMTYRHNRDGGVHEVSLDASALRRGSYRITVPLLKERELTPSGTEFVPFVFEFIVRVRGLGFVSDRLAVGHYIGDDLQVRTRSMLAGGDLPWRITDTPSWLRVGTPEGASLTHLELEFSRDASLDALGTGHYEGRLCVENERGDAASIPVYGVVERPSLRPLHTQRFLYTFAAAEQLHSYTYVFTDLADQVAWEATSNQPWLLLARSTGLTNERIDFRVDPTGLRDGRHTAELIFSDPSGRHHATRVVVHYLKDPRPSSWTLVPTSGFSLSPVTSQRVVHANDGGIAMDDLLSGGRVPVPSSQGGLSAIVSEHSHRLFVRKADEIRSYSVPDVLELETTAVGNVASGPTASGVVSVFDEEYWDCGATVVRVDDGRVGPMLAATTPAATRPRIYDGGDNTFFGFHEDLGEPRPDGWIHWARSPTALCRFEGGDADWQFRCADEGGVYLDVLPDPHPQVGHIAFTPLFTHTGGVYLHYIGLDSTKIDFAVSADGVARPVSVQEPLVRSGRLYGDTILVGEAAARSISDLFELAD